MGLFDGQIGGQGFASTAHVASLVRAPVILVMDISHTSRTAAAIVHGLNTFDPGVRLSGVIINKAGSERHAREIVESIQATGLEVLGVLPRDAGIEIPSRHLGLVPAAEREEAAAAVAQLGQQIRDHVALTSIMSIAQSAPALEAAPWSPSKQVQPPSDARPVVAIAAGRAFTFRYTEIDELLRAAGCEPVTFDPASDQQLPAGTAGLYLGGGFPEVHAADLAANKTLRSEIRSAIAAGMPTVAECAGLLYLCRSVDGLPMVGAIEADAIMTEKLTLSYRTLIADHEQLLAAAGARLTGHEFHRTTIEPGRGVAAAWLVDGEPAGFSTDPAGIGRDTLHASYLHVHWAGYPDLAQRFADAVHDHAVADRPELAEGLQPLHDLHHHGDSTLPKAWSIWRSTSACPLRRIGSARSSTAQPSTSPPTPRPTRPPRPLPRPTTSRSIRSCRLPEAPEAFTLLARAIRAERPLIIHPQFTEPEAALIAAGHQPRRLILSPATGFRLDIDQLPTDADLVVIGNPTNPTSVLHPAALLNSLRRPDVSSSSTRPSWTRCQERRRP